MALPEPSLSTVAQDTTLLNIVISLISGKFKIILVAFCTVMP